MWLDCVSCDLLVVLIVGLLSVHGKQIDENSRIVHTSQGPVKGYRAPEGDLFTFYNIPYATAPTGKDKFKAPLPGPVWTEPLEAVDKQIICHQADKDRMLFQINAKQMQEDCLIANVYTPDTKVTNLPVVVIIHGGAFQIGYGDQMTPKHLVQSKKIVAVNFNYRLGAQGFLCLGTPNAPGNAGLKDQVAALRWVNENIANFGGNPNDVTIEGYSAGSASVDLLLLSKSAKGLFHKAIVESGVSIDPWAVQSDPIGNAKQYVEEYAQEYATQNKLVNLEDIKVLEEFYTAAPYEVLFKDDFILKKENHFIFTPCVEQDVGEVIVLADNPFNILKKGDYNKVPMLYGFSKDEGLFRVQFGYAIYKDGMNKKFSDYIPTDLQFESNDEKEEVAKKIKEFYFGNKTVGESISDYIDYYTDFMFASSTLRALTLQVEAGNDKIYLYEYSFPQKQPFTVPGIAEELVGSNHCAQTIAVFDLETLLPGSKESDLPEDYQKIKAMMREIWINFITTGKPTGSALAEEWAAAGAHGAPYMELGLPPALRGELLPRRARFWDEIYGKHYRAPAPAQPPKRA